MVLKETIYVPVLTVLPVFLIKIGVVVLKEIKILPFLLCVSLIKQKWLYFAGG